MVTRVEPSPGRLSLLGFCFLFGRQLGKLSFYPPALNKARVTALSREQSGLTHVFLTAWAGGLEEEGVVRALFCRLPALSFLRGDGPRPHSVPKSMTKCCCCLRQFHYVDQRHCPWLSCAGVKSMCHLPSQCGAYCQQMHKGPRHVSYAY